MLNLFVIKLYKLYKQINKWYYTIVSYKFEAIYRSKRTSREFCSISRMFHFYIYNLKLNNFKNNILNLHLLRWINEPTKMSRLNKVYLTLFYFFIQRCSPHMKLFYIYITRYTFSALFRLTQYVNKFYWKIHLKKNYCQIIDLGLTPISH